MKIKIINPNTTAVVTSAMARVAAGLVRPGTKLVTVSPEMGPAAIEGFYDEAFSAIGVLDEIRKGEQEGCDGYVIACFGDPGLAAAREMVRAPVLGIAEAAMHAASFLGTSFSIVSMVERVRPMIERAVRENGMTDRCRSIRMVGLPLLEFSGEAKSRLIETCRTAVETDGADCIIMGSGGLAEYGPAIAKELGVSVVDGVAVALKFVEALVDMGYSTSKQHGYAFPPAKTYSGIFKAYSPRVPECRGDPSIRCPE